MKARCPHCQVNECQLVPREAYGVRMKRKHVSPLIQDVVGVILRMQAVGTTKTRSISTGLHGATSQSTVILIVVAMRT